MNEQIQNNSGLRAASVRSEVSRSFCAGGEQLAYYCCRVVDRIDHECFSRRMAKSNAHPREDTASVSLTSAQHDFQSSHRTSPLISRATSTIPISTRRFFARASADVLRRRGLDFP